MKYILSIKKVIAVVAGAFLFSFCQANTGETITLQNKTARHYTDELIVLKKQVIQNKIGTVPAGKYALLNAPGNAPLVVQYDDTDGDGIWDELCFLYSFKPKEKLVLMLSMSDAPATIKAVVRAHARHKRKNANDVFGNDLLTDSIPTGQAATDFKKQNYPPFLTEGPAWENDKVGFRLYFDVRNGKDIWGKTTPRMMMDEVGTDKANNYHKEADWGMDILKVGNSLGAGSLALQIPLDGRQDTLVRLGGSNMGHVQYEKIADGPVRAIIRLHYPEWKVLNGSDPVRLTEEISISGGQYFYESRVTVTGAPANSKLVTGIVNLHKAPSNQLSNKPHKTLYTYGKQSANNDHLGMAIVMDKKYFNSYGTTPNTGTDITNTYFVAANIQEQPVVFRFYACWEKSDKRFKTAGGVGDFLLNETVRLEHPIVIN